MRRVLVLTPHEDRAERAATLASQLARKTGARLTLLRVLEESLGTVESSAADRRARPLRDLLIDVETRRLEELAERIRGDDVDVSVEVCWGVSWEVILERVEQDGYDLVVKPASGLNVKGPVFFGSTALHLFRRCPCPVWVVGDEGRLPATVLSAIDPSSASRRRDAARRILGWTELVAEWGDASLHVASAWHAAGADVLGDILESGELKEYERTTRDQAQRDLDSLLAACSPSARERHVHLVEGTPQDVLPRLAEEHAVDMIVIGTRGREDRAGDLLGETAETIIRQVRSSVLTIPPTAEVER